MKLLSEALGEALALVEKATPGHAEMRVRVADDSIYVCMGDRRKGAHAQGDVCLPEDDVFALVQGLNFLRQHGPAIAAALREVEEAAVGLVNTYGEDDELAVFGDAIDGMKIGQRVALVPLDAAGSAEGVS